MNKNSLAIAEAYYTAMGKKNVAGMEKCLHPDVQFIGPLAKMEGKEAVLEAAKRLTSLFKSLTIRAQFGSENQVMLVLDLDFPAPIGNCPSASLMTFQEGLVAKLELFYDARLFDRKKDEIFS